MDFKGKYKYGRLTILSIHDYEGRKYCMCQCDCGIKKDFLLGNVINGKSKSCGCLATENRSLPSGEGSKRILFRNYKNNAKHRSLEFDIDIDLFSLLTKQDCYYCGDSPSMICGTERNNGTYTYNGIDRVDNNLGYVKGNCVPCCRVCNEAKSANPDFLGWIRKVYNNLKNK